jgi:hypothetical protein
MADIMGECKKEFNGQLNRYPVNFQERYGFPLNKLKDRLSEIQWLCAKGRVKRIFYKDLEEVGFDLTKKAKRKAEEAGGANSSVTDGGSTHNKKKIHRRGTPIVTGAAIGKSEADLQRMREEAIALALAGNQPMTEETKRDMEERHHNDIVRVKTETAAHIRELLKQIEILKATNK